MHRLGVIHRDIKPENILLNDKLQPKLADFGLAVEFDFELGDREKVQHGNAFDGTPSYAPPEAFFGNNYNSTWDTFSIMCSIFFFKFGKVCWEFGGKSWPDEKICDFFADTCQERIAKGTSEEDVEIDYLSAMHILPKNNFVKRRSNDDYEWTDKRVEFGKFAQRAMCWDISKRLTVPELCETDLFKDIVNKWESAPDETAAEFRKMIDDWVADDTYIDDKWLVF